MVRALRAQLHHFDYSPDFGDGEAVAVIRRHLLNCMFVKRRVRCGVRSGFGLRRKACGNRFCIQRQRKMSIFEFRKPVAEQPHRNQLVMLRQTLDRLEAETEETPQIADLKRILAGRIAELKRKTA